MRKLTAVLLMMAVLFVSSAAVKADSEQIADLIDKLLSSNYVVATQASKDLVALGADVIPHVAERVLGDTQWTNRLKGVTVLRELGVVEGIPYLMQLLGDETRRSRWRPQRVDRNQAAKGVEAEEVLLNYWFRSVLSSGIRRSRC